MSNQNIVPFHVPSIGEEEIQEVARVLRSGWLTTGGCTAHFEKEFQEYVHAGHALAVNSCTAALHLALAGLGIGPGDEVITTPITFCATVNSIIHLGATPVLADVRPDGNIDPAAIAARITPRTRALLPVHFAGLPCEMNAIWNLAEQHGLHVVEDAAHAVGTHYKFAPIGATTTRSASDAVAFSFYATKNLTTGEGGMLTTGNEELSEKVRRMALHGISRNAWNRYAENGSWQYDVVEPGFKYNLSDIQAAIGRQQLKRLEGFIATRARWAQRYHASFQRFEELETPPDCATGRHSWHLYVLRLNLDKLSIDRNQFIVELKQRGIGTSVHFIPIPQLSFFSPWAHLAHNRCPRAAELFSRSISLPLYPGMTEEQVDYTARAVTDIVQANRQKSWASSEAGAA